MERRLSAILAVDVVGYSRLMENDEADTFERLRTHRKDLFEPEIAGHHGRIFKLTGDGLLAEFGSVVDAVECAVLLQRQMAERNNGLADGQRIDVRMGINLGDVIIEDDDRHGEGVVIAARLQQLAEPGGIAVSGTVADHVKHKLALRFESRGYERRKYFEPVSAYRVLADGTAGPETNGSTHRKSGASRAAVASALILHLRWRPAAWHFYPRADGPQAAFLNCCAAIHQHEYDTDDYFSDGVRRHHHPSWFPDLTVVSRQSSCLQGKEDVRPWERIGRYLCT
jgi:class 3 adenylate cyclase